MRPYNHQRSFLEASPRVASPPLSSYDQIINNVVEIGQFTNFVTITTRLEDFDEIDRPHAFDGGGRS